MISELTSGLNKLLKPAPTARLSIWKRRKKEFGLIHLLTTRYHIASFFSFVYVPNFANNLQIGAKQTAHYEVK